MKIILFPLLLGFVACTTKIPTVNYQKDGLLNAQENTIKELKSVGQYRGNGSCTAVLVKVSESTHAPAYVLTNGHCVQQRTANDVFRNLEAKNHHVTFNIFKDIPQESQLKVKVNKIVYSTMKGTDLAIVELNSSIADLMKQGLKPLNIAKKLTKEGTTIRAFGIPVNGIQPQEQFLRQSTCQQGDKTDLIEFTWSWWDMYNNECANIFGGSSGSPVIADFENGVIGLLNTTTINAGTPCYMGAPCEITNKGVVMKENTSYMLSVVGIQNCFTSSGIFDINSSGCKLNKDSGIKISGQPSGAVNPNANEILKGPAARNLNIKIENKKYYRYKLGEQGEDDPRSKKGYSKIFTVADDPVINDLIPEKDGYYFISVIGGDSPNMDETWQEFDFPTVQLFQVKTSAPNKELIVNVRENKELFIINFGYSPPELSKYVYKIGAVSKTRADDMDGFTTYLGIPVRIQKKDLPQKLIVIAYDNAGNPTPVYEKIFE